MRDLKTDLELCNKATPGPWYREKTGENFQGFSLEQVIASTSNFATGNKVYATPKSGSFPANDADFISQAREGWPHAIERAIKAEALAQELVEALEMAFDLLEHHQPIWYLWAHFHQINNALGNYKETMGDIPKCAKCGKELHNCIYWLDGDKVCKDCYTKEYLVAIYDSEEPKLNRLVCPKCKGTREERYTDAAGSRDYRICNKCDGKGFIIV